MTQAVTSAAIAWKGSLGRLRRAGCPTLAPLQADGMPRHAILVLDHTAILDVVDSTMEALAGPGYDNTLIVPELAVDFFDRESKATPVEAFRCETTTAAVAAAATNSNSNAPRGIEHVLYALLQQKKRVLLNRDKYRVKVQRVMEYDTDCLTELNLNRQAYDVRLYVACALYYKKAERLPVIIVSTDKNVLKTAEKYGIPTCPAKDICSCAHLLAA